MAQAVSTLTPYANRGRTHSQRELGVYELPDGSEFVVSTLYTGGRSLYLTRAWSHYGGAEYGVDPYGRLCSRGEPTRWKLTDLVDTGRTAKYPVPVIR